MTMEQKKVMTRGTRSKNKEWTKKKDLVAKPEFEIWCVCPMRQVPTLKRDQVKFIDCTVQHVTSKDKKLYTIRRFGHYVRQDSEKTC
jgi:hypothetical protein